RVFPVVFSTRIFPSFASVTTFATIVGAGLGDGDAVGDGVGLAVVAVPPQAATSNAVARLSPSGRIWILPIVCRIPYAPARHMDELIRLVSGGARAYGDRRRVEGPEGVGPLLSPPRTLVPRPGRRSRGGHTPLRYPPHARHARADQATPARLDRAARTSHASSLRVPVR